MSLHFVTGAAGFLGSQIVEHLHRKGERVIAFDILPARQQLSGVRYVVGDVLDKELVKTLMKEVEYVHHNAALVPLTKAGEGFQRVNVGGTRVILELCKEFNIKKLVYMSSSAIYGVPTDVPVTDQTDCKPIEAYGQSKLDAEELVRAYMAAGGAAACIRPRTIIGGKSRLGIFSILFEWISKGKKIYVIGDGSNLFQFVHVQDLIEAEYKATFSPHSGLYNIGAATYGTLRQDLEALIRHAGTRSRVVSLPVTATKVALWLADLLRLSPLAPWHYLTYHKPFAFDISKAQRELGWQPAFSNVEALIESYEWYLSHKNDGSDDASIHTKPVAQGLLKILQWFS